ncbi:hypothetical protein [Wenyingzhuangia sp. IMCC45574]
MNNKSIEDIWKEGFVKENDLVAPKINNLYNQKSKGAVDKFFQIGKINIIGIIVAAIVVLIGSYFMETLVAGGLIFALLLWFAYYSKKQADILKKLDKGMNSYDYIKTVNEWVRESTIKYVKIYRFFYPLFFIIFFPGVWYSKYGKIVTEKFLRKFPNTDTFLNVPSFNYIILAVVVLLLIVFAKKIFQLDVTLVYGRVLKKLETLEKDMEKLR